MRHGSAITRQGLTVPERMNVLGVGVHPINIDQALAAIGGWIEHGEKRYVCLAPVHSILACQKDPNLRRIFNQSGLTTPDGMPLVWIARARGYRQADRVYGPELLLAACERFFDAGIRHYFVGGEEQVARNLRSRLEARFPGLRVVGTHSPPFRAPTDAEADALLREINEAQPDLIWVGLGSPKQERWMAGHVDRLDRGVLIGVGAAFDFLSGRKPWAPRWIQRSGFEWLFRLITEPRRLWRRYLSYPLFVFLFAAQVLGLKRYPLK